MQNGKTGTYQNLRVINRRTIAGEKEKASRAALAAVRCRLVKLTFPRRTGRLSLIRAYFSCKISILQTFYTSIVLLG